MAAVGATCYYWLTPYGALWTVVEETEKYGYVKKLVACGAGGTGIFADLETDPYMPQYDPYGAGYNCDDSPPRSGGGGGGGSNSSCHEEWIVIEISYDGGITWETWWEGYATVCE